VKVTLIYNPDAGGDNQPSPGHLMELIHSAGHEATCHSCKESGWNKALGEPVDLVAVAGGDGIVGQLAKRLVGKHTPIAVLPMGAANNIAVFLGVNNLPARSDDFRAGNQGHSGFSLGNRAESEEGLAGAILRRSLRA
jgi:diacylglycerol kinase (ATP)